MKNIRLLLPALLFILSASSAQEAYYKHRPWPDFRKEQRAPAHALQDVKSLFTTSTHLDTATFTRYPADLAGVIVGNAQWIDFDNDGNLDIFVSGTDGTKPIAKLYRNDIHNDTGTFHEVVDAGIPPIVTERGVAWGDFDNDGDFDLAITGTLDSAGTMPVSRIYRNDGGHFTDIGAPLVPVLGGVAKWVDYNLDGKLDLLIAGSHDRGSTFFTKLYRNDGSTFTDCGQYFPGVWGASVDWGDFDNDGDPDLLLTGYGDWGVTSAIFRNDSGTFSFISPPFTPVNFSAVSWGDFDNDGYLDFVVSGDPPGWDSNTFTALYHGRGDGTFDYVPTNLPQLNGCAVAWGDYDNDGDLDLAIDGWHDDSTNMTKIFRNDGNGVFTDIGADLPGTWWGSVAWGDVDNDGRLDLLISGGTGPQPFAAFYYNSVPWQPFYPITAIYHNNGDWVNGPPGPPSTTAAQREGGKVTFSWGASTDDKTPPPMLSYNLRVGSTPGAADIVAPTSNLASGFRRVPQPGNTGHKQSRSLTLPDGQYYWSVQSVDNGYMGSAFTSEQRTINITTRWRLVSVPSVYADQHLALVYPNARSHAFTWSTSTYAIVDLLENGAGYWVQFKAGEAPQLAAAGTAIPSLTVTLKPGWNLIGGISVPVPVGAITGDPPGLTTSQFFGYSGGYKIADTIEPGCGYWVHVTQDASITLASSAAIPAAGIRVAATGETPPEAPGDEIAAPPRPQLPKDYALRQNYPNPFNPATRIGYALPASGMVRLSIYNVLGELVAVPVSGYQTAGEKFVEFDGSALPSGVYYVRLTAGAFSDVKRMVLLR